MVFLTKEDMTSNPKDFYLNFLSRELKSRNLLKFRQVSGIVAEAAFGGTWCATFEKIPKSEKLVKGKNAFSTNKDYSEIVGHIRDKFPEVYQDTHQLYLEELQEEAESIQKKTEVKKVTKKRRKAVEKKAEQATKVQELSDVDEEEDFTMDVESVDDQVLYQKYLRPRMKAEKLLKFKRAGGFLNENLYGGNYIVYFGKDDKKELEKGKNGFSDTKDFAEVVHYLKVNYKDIFDESLQEYFADIEGKKRKLNSTVFKSKKQKVIEVDMTSDDTNSQVSEVEVGEELEASEDVDLEDDEINSQFSEVEVYREVDLSISQRLVNKLSSDCREEEAKSLVYFLCGEGDSSVGVLLGETGTGKAFVYDKVSELLNTEISSKRKIYTNKFIVGHVGEFSVIRRLILAFIDDVLSRHKKIVPKKSVKKTPVKKPKDNPYELQRMENIRSNVEALQKLLNPDKEILSSPVMRKAQNFDRKRITVNRIEEPTAVKNISPAVVDKSQKAEAFEVYRAKSKALRTAAKNNTAFALAARSRLIELEEICEEDDFEMHLVICLDKVEKMSGLSAEETELLIELFQTRFALESEINTPRVNFKLVMMCNDDKMDDYFRKKEVNVIEFSKYTQEEMKHILLLKSKSVSQWSLHEEMILHEFLDYTVPALKGFCSTVDKYTNILDVLWPQYFEAASPDMHNNLFSRKNTWAKAYSSKWKQSIVSLIAQFKDDGYVSHVVDLEGNKVTFDEDILQNYLEPWKVCFIVAGYMVGINPPKFDDAVLNGGKSLKSRTNNWSLRMANLAGKEKKGKPFTPKRLKQLVCALMDQILDESERADIDYLLCENTLEDIFKLLVRQGHLGLTRSFSWKAKCLCSPYDFKDVEPMFNTLYIVQKDGLVFKNYLADPAEFQ